MSSFYCAISGEICQNAVVSVKSGHVYERRVIEKYLEQTGKCPISDQQLGKEDLIDLKATSLHKPRPANGTNIPSLITIFQSEWDALMLELYTTKQNLETVREELSHALFQYDAATRVISRLLKERDEARNLLADYEHKISEFKTQLPKPEIAVNKILPEKLVQSIYDLKSQLAAQRKELRKEDYLLKNFASQEMIHQFSAKKSIALHTGKPAGITALDIHSENADLFVSGGNDGSVSFYNSALDKVLEPFKTHKSKVNDVAFVSSHSFGDGSLLALSASEDKTGHLISHNLEKNKSTSTYKISASGALRSVSVHPLNTLALSSSIDGKFQLHDLVQGKILAEHAFDKKVGISVSRINPDGEIGAFAGTDGVLRFWNLPEHALLGSINAHSGEISTLAFSENGYNFVTSSVADKIVKLWDLRKLEDKNFITIHQGSGSASFDKSGRYLAVGVAKELFLYNVKTNENFSKIVAHKDQITALRFGKQSKFLASASLDGNLALFA